MSDVLPLTVAADPTIGFVIITGLSGAGKSFAIKCFEDMGYFCVDNLPTTLIPTFAELCMQSNRPIRRVEWAHSSAKVGISVVGRLSTQ